MRTFQSFLIIAIKNIFAASIYSSKEIWLENLKIFFFLNYENFIIEKEIYII